MKEKTLTVADLGCKLVELTGGEPLLQENVPPLMTMLADAGFTVLLETSGAHDCTSGPCRSILADLGRIDPREIVE